MFEFWVFKLKVIKTFSEGHSFIIGKSKLNPKIKFRDPSLRNVMPKQKNSVILHHYEAPR